MNIRAALTAGLVGVLLSCAAAAAPSNVGGRSSSDAFTGSQDILPGVDVVSLSAGGLSSGFDASLTLSTGQLHVDARSGAGTWSQGWAIINDTIHIVGALPTSFSGTLTLSVDGEITNGGSDPSIGIRNYGYAFASLGAGTGLGNSVHQSFFVSNDCTGLVGTTASCSLGGAFSDSIIIPFTVDDQHRNVYIQAALDGNAYFGARTNFFNTGTLSIQLQPGLTFTSASGLLLTASPAPEPSTYALLGAGLLVIALRVKPKSTALLK